MKKALKNTAIAFIVSASLLTFTSCNKEKIPTPEEEGVVPYDQITYPSGADCELDLTALNTQLKNTKVFDILAYHDNYVGVTVKLDGRFKVIDNNGKKYYACEFLNVEDEYEQFLEFVLGDDKKYPEDYPQEGDMITVLGTLEKRESGIHIVNAVIVSNDSVTTTTTTSALTATNTGVEDDSTATSSTPSSITASVSASSTTTSAAE